MVARAKYFVIFAHNAASVEVKGYDWGEITRICYLNPLLGVCNSYNITSPLKDKLMP